MRHIADHFARAGVPLAANQVNYSLLRRAAETNGVLEACRELDVALVAYFPLASGRLTQPSDSMGTKALLTSDVLLYVNGLPVVFIELKNSNVKLKAAFDDNVANYKREIPQLFLTN